jgi:hypothetical protein
MITSLIFELQHHLVLKLEEQIKFLIYSFISLNKKYINQTTLWLCSKSLASPKIKKAEMLMTEESNVKSFNLFSKIVFINFKRIVEYKPNPMIPYFTIKNK